jgi:hypothetical protein
MERRDGEPEEFDPVEAAEAELRGVDRLKKVAEVLGGGAAPEDMAKVLEFLEGKVGDVLGGGAAPEDMAKAMELLDEVEQERARLEGGAPQTIEGQLARLEELAVEAKVLRLYHEAHGRDADTQDELVAWAETALPQGVGDPDKEDYEAARGELARDEEEEKEEESKP